MALGIKAILMEEVFNVLDGENLLCLNPGNYNATHKALLVDMTNSAVI
jgi:hypothetical protein